MKWAARGLYAITDGPRPDLVAAVRSALEGGARIIQYRDKTEDAIRRAHEARQLAEACRSFGVPLIINDDIDLAREVGAAGVHLGEDDGDIAVAREVLGADAIIGVSCYDSVQRAQDAAAKSASYVAFGAFFPSLTKPLARRASLELIEQTTHLGVPRVAIGGITQDNARALIDAGVEFIAVITGVFAAADIRLAAQDFSDLFSSHRESHELKP
jgi:thiamine-phosphate pyrophosphorylase